MHSAATDIIEARGHRFVALVHPTTIEITKENEMTRRGDCILAVGASKSAAELNPEIKRVLNVGGRLVITVECSGIRDVVQAMGSSRMTFSDGISLVIRRSRYVDGRTVGILSDKAAKDIDRRLARQLRTERATVTIRLDTFLPNH